MIGILIVIVQHRNRLSLGAAGVWGGLTFVFVLAARLLTFPQALMLIPPESPIPGFLGRVALEAVVVALQWALLMGLMVATGEAIARERLPRATTLTRIRPRRDHWPGAMGHSLRWGLLVATGMLAVEALVGALFGSAGFSAKLPHLLAGVLSSPFKATTGVMLCGLDMIRDEGIFRVWMLPLLLLWVRIPLAVIVTAGTAAYFVGFDLNQFVSISGLLFIVWGIAAGLLAARVGIYATLFFHMFALGGYLALALLWTDLGSTSGFALLSVMGLVIASVSVWEARER